MSKTNWIESWEPSTAQRGVRDYVAALYNLSPEEICGRRRTRRVVDPRHLAMWVLWRTFPALTYSMVGKLLGGRDRSTAWHGISEVEARLSRDSGFAEWTAQLLEVICNARMKIEVSEHESAHMAALAARMVRPAWVRGKRTAAAMPTQRVKPKNQMERDDSDAMMRHAGTLRLAAALREARAA